MTAGTEKDERALDEDFGDDRSGVELRPADRIEGVAQKVRVGPGDQQRASRHDQAPETRAEAEREREDDGGDRRQRNPEDDQGPEIVAKLARAARRLAGVERRKAQVRQHRDQAGVGDEGGVAAVVGVAERVGEGDHDHEGDDARDRPGGKDEERVADDARAELLGRAFGRVRHGREVWARASPALSLARPRAR